MRSACLVGFLVIVCGAACAGRQKPGSPEPGSRGVTVERMITGPAIIAIVSPDAEARSSPREDRISDLAEIQLTLSDARECLEPLEVDASMVPADRLVLVHEGRRLVAYPQPDTGAVDPSGEAVVLIRPGGEPRTILRGTNSIGRMILSDLPAYFEVPSCDSKVYVHKAPGDAPRAPGPAAVRPRGRTAARVASHDRSSDGVRGRGGACGRWFQVRRMSRC